MCTTKQAAEPALHAGSDWQWADRIDPVVLQRMASVTLPLLQQPERWIHRRVERIYFKDYDSVHQQVSVDFTLPAGMPPVSSFDGHDVYIAPLFLVRKGPSSPLRTGKEPRRRFLLFGKRRAGPPRRRMPTPLYANVDFVDQTGQRQPLLTQRQCRTLSATVLLMAAEQTVEWPIDDALRSKLLSIARAPREDLSKILRYVFEEPAFCWETRSKLRTKAFRELAYMLASHTIVACLFMNGPPQRSIYKLSYDTPLGEADRVGGRFRRTYGKRTTKVLRYLRWRGRQLQRGLGWMPQQLFIKLNEIGASASYHVEISIPAELEATAVGMYGHRYKLFGRNPRLMTAEEREYSILQVARTSQGDIHVPEPLPGRRVGEVWVNLRACRPGFLRGALTASSITALVLFAAVLKTKDLIRADRSEAAVALLLLMPAILAAYVAQPGGHALTTKMLTWARVALVLDAALPFAAALFLLSTPGETSSSALAAPTPTGGAVTVAIGNAEGRRGSTRSSSPGAVTVTIGQPNAKAERTRAERAAKAAAAREDKAVDGLRKQWLWLAIASPVLLAQFLTSYFRPPVVGGNRYRPLRDG